MCSPRSATCHVISHVLLSSHEFFTILGLCTALRDVACASCLVSKSNILGSLVLSDWMPGPLINLTPIPFSTTLTLLAAAQDWCWWYHAILEVRADLRDRAVTHLSDASMTFALLLNESCIGKLSCHIDTVTQRRDGIEAVTDEQ